MKFLHSWVVRGMFDFDRLPYVLSGASEYHLLNLTGINHPTLAPPLTF
jgi:hypothetical protein